MITRLHVILGLGGTGKTREILEAVRAHKEDGAPDLYLCFNRPLRESTKDKLLDSRADALTVHGLAYRALAEVDRLPEELSGIRNEDEITKQGAFRKLLAAFHATFVEEGVELPPRLGRYGHVFVDELQNLDDDLLMTVKDVTTLVDAELWLVGDPLQSGYGFQEKDRRRPGNFERVEEIFGRAPDETVELTKNHRSAPAIVAFVDGYLGRAFGGEKILRYDQSHRGDAGIAGGEHGRPRIEIFGRAGEEAAHVIEQINTILADDGSASIAVLSRYDRDLEVYRRARIEGPRSTISTIHSFIGREAEHVFLVGFQDPVSSKKNDPKEEHEERCIIYTALIRARTSLSVSTSYPNVTPERWFDPETCEIAVHDIERSKPYGRFPKIRVNANYSRRKYDLASIDSITLRVPFDRVPYFPYVAKAQGKRSRGKGEGKKEKDASSFTKREIEDHDGVQVAISYHTSHRYYEFTLSDTNLLHRSGFTDVHVIKFLTNYILEYFDGRVGIDDIIVSRVDVYRLFDGTDEIEELIAETDWVQKEKVVSCRGKNSWRTFRGEAAVGRVLRQETIYVNLSKKKEVTLALYKPYLKSNDNRIFDRKLAKAEVRMKGDALRRRYALGSASVRSILEELAKDGDRLRKMADSVLEARGAKMSKSGGCFMGRKEEDGAEGEGVGAK
jgi:hypothetical protein